jgi:hypothetical protein
MTDEERIYWIERCLRLELRIAILEGYATESPPPPPPRLVELQLAPLLPRESQPSPHRSLRNATDEEIASMRDLKQRGLSNTQVGRRVGFSECTVRRYTRDVLIEREVGR